MMNITFFNFAIYLSITKNSITWNVIILYYFLIIIRYITFYIIVIVYDFISWLIMIDMLTYVAFVLYEQ